MQEPQHIPIAADVESASDGGDLYEDSSVASLRSSILENQAENGRTYHSMSAGKYSFPNDEKESDRLGKHFKSLRHGIPSITSWREHNKCGILPITTGRYNFLPIKYNARQRLAGRISRHLHVL
ncbi:hypothetical protein EsH8_IX_000422 [Colletotrichum jinshuiense]